MNVAPSTGSALDNRKENFMKFTKTTFALTAAAMSLGLAACDGPTEEAMEDQAEAGETAMEEQADTLDAQGMDDAADAMNEQADDYEDAMEAQADTVGEEMDGNEM